MAAIKVLVCGAAGKMGSEVVRAVVKEEGLELVGAVDTQHAGEDIGVVAGLGSLGLNIADSLEAAIDAAAPQVMVDFTVPGQAIGNIRTAIGKKVACVIGTTGFSQDDLDEIARLCAQNETAALIAPNFAIGAVLMMEFAARAARFFPQAEIVELHHDKKLDAPSGTALLTARMMAHTAGCALQPPAREDSPPRGQLTEGKVRIHSVRLPGLVAHQEVVFGGTGQTLTVRHDSLNRESFMPGVVLAIRKIVSMKGLTIGLEQIL